MIRFTTVSALQEFLISKKNQQKSIGFVPTMGALHDGHLSLVKKSMTQNDLTVVSIFVNPLQFNNPDDLKKYPRTLEKDEEKLQAIGCDVLFAPGYDDVYPEQISESYDFGYLSQVMEGAHRPGHFNGVAIVVKRLFDIVMPHRAYFGEKDYQQLLIVKALVKQHNLPIEIVPVEIVREANGLAMSSRNELLSPAARQEAGLIFKVLTEVKQLYENLSVSEIKEYVKKQFEKKPGFSLEYFEIADNKTLQIISDSETSNEMRAFIVVHVENVRLIDNILLTKKIP